MRLEMAQSVHNAFESQGLQELLKSLSAPHHSNSGLLGVSQELDEGYRVVPSFVDRKNAVLRRGCIRGLFWLKEERCCILALSDISF